MQAQVKHVLKTYGRTALLFHSSLFVATLSGAYGAIRYGVDIEKFLDKIPFVDLSKADPNASSLMLAYVSTLATGPARGALTIGVSPVLARWLAKRSTTMIRASQKKSPMQ
ncbi:hypothetical protein Poli38472_000438 [Pythium oligandrum]|uniref:DUF1279 domain-containing protein n=1 Tax=Pythium oligandrum TaxID=41045 RepID=A0A8K1CBQ9_PYTOL|nr:hypothetical protein Poli38472_000438 [Pythium oligandrum]|eukprot:TMW60396.1 hypothetical protein Poli38472_000438 [Pythium oligandrum]